MDIHYGSIRNVLAQVRRTSRLRVRVRVRVRVSVITIIPSQNLTLTVTLTMSYCDVSSLVRMFYKERFLRPSAIYD